MQFTTLLTTLIHAISLSSSLPIDPNEPKEDLLQASHISLQDMANIAMSPHLEVLNKTLLEVPLPVPIIQLPEKLSETSGSLELSNNGAIQTQMLEIPFQVASKTGSVGGKVSAAAAIKGSVVGSALATPVILKAVALPGIAAGKTAGLFSLPHLIIANARSVSQNLAANVQNSIQDKTNQISDFLVENQILAAEEADDEEQHGIPLLPTIDLQEGINNAVQKVVLLKAGALGAAAKGVVMAKKGAYVAGRIFLKPIAILTGIQLNMIGSGLTIGGKLIGGTGAGIAKAGTAVKYTGLGAIGLGASAVSWGLDKSTISSNTRIEANAKLN